MAAAARSCYWGRRCGRVAARAIRGLLYCCPCAADAVVSPRVWAVMMKQGTEACSILLATRGDVMRWQGAALRGGFAVCCLVRLGGAFLPIAIPDVPELRHFSCFEGMLLKKRFRIRSCGRLEVGWRGKSCRFPMQASLRKIRIYKAPVQSYARLRYIVTPSHSRNSTYFQSATTSNFRPKIQQHCFEFAVAMHLRQSMQAIAGTRARIVLIR